MCRSLLGFLQKLLNHIIDQPTDLAERISRGRRGNLCEREAPGLPCEAAQDANELRPGLGTRSSPNPTSLNSDMAMRRKSWRP